MITVEEFKKELHAIGEIKIGEPLIIEKYNIHLHIDWLPSFQLYRYYENKLRVNKRRKRLITIFRSDDESYLRAKRHYYYEKLRNEIWDSIMEQLKNDEIP